MAAPMDRLTAHVQIDYGASDEEVQAVENLFRELGVEVDVTPGIMQFSEIPPWVFALIIELNPSS